MSSAAPSDAVSSLPQMMFPSTTELPARVAAALRESTRADERECAVAGCASTAVAVLEGFADGEGFTESQRSQLGVALRRELRQLSQRFGAAPTVVAAADGSSAEVSGARLGPFDVVVEWCATPAVPSYSVGVHLALGDDDGTMHRVTKDLAWVFRMLCQRRRIAADKEAPMIHAVYEALCGAQDGKAGRIREALDLGLELNMRASMSFCSPHDFSDQPTRSVSR